jgi:hypothetical protein
MDDPPLGGDVFADLARAQARHHHGVGLGTGDRVAGGGQMVGDAVGLGGPDLGHRAGDLGDDVFHRRVRDQTAPAQDDEVVGRQSHLAHQVAGQEDGPPVPGQAFDQFAYPGHALRVEAVDRLVQDQGGGVAQEGPGQTQTLAHAEGEAAHPFVRHRPQASQLDHFVHPPPADAVGGGQSAQMGAGGAAGVGGLGVEQGPDLLQGGAVFDVTTAVDCDRAVGGAVQAQDQTHGGRFASSVGAEEAGDQTRPDFKGQAVDGTLGAEVLGQVIADDHGWPSSTSPG